MKKFVKKSFMGLATSIFLLGSAFGVASAEEDTKEETANVTYSCTTSVSGLFSINFNMDAEIKATVPTSVSPNSDFNITNASATVTIPASAVNTMRSFLFWGNMKGKVTKFELETTNEIDDEIDERDLAYPTPIDIPETTVPSSGDLVFTVPNTGGLDVLNLTAGSSGSVSIYAGDISAEFEKGSGFGLPAKLYANCTPSGDAKLIDIEIN